MLSIALSALGVNLWGIKNNRSTSEWGAISPRPDPPTAISDSRSVSDGSGRGCKCVVARWNTSITTQSVNHAIARVVDRALSGSFMKAAVIVAWPAVSAFFKCATMSPRGTVSPSGVCSTVVVNAARNAPRSIISSAGQIK